MGSHTLLARAFSSPCYNSAKKKLKMHDLTMNWYVMRRKAKENAFKNQGNNPIIWVDRAYNPQDLRASVPVPRHKPLVAAVDNYKPSKSELLPHIQKVDGCIVSSAFPSTVATRCEDSSTLTMMLPTTGIPVKQRPPNWGTAQGCPPRLWNETSPHNRYHRLSSPMTRYVDHMHHTNKLFKLH